MAKLKSKLIRTNLTILILSFAIVGSLVYYGLNSLTSTLLKIGQDRSQVIQQTFENTSASNIEKLKSIFKDAMINKGHRLAEKDGISLAPMLTDNAFMRLREFLAGNFKGDSEILAAMFFVKDKDGIRGWQYLDKKYPEGLDLPVEYNIKKSTWSSKYKGKLVTVVDNGIAEVVKTTSIKVVEKEFQYITKEGESKKVLALDCYIPVFEKNDPKLIADAVKKGEPVGFLRYVISLEKLQMTITQEETKSKGQLDKLSTENKMATFMSLAVGKNSLEKIITVLGGCAVGIFVISWIFGLISSTKITNPVIELTKIAESMAQGNYKQVVNVKTDDEIGVLAKTFQSMSDAITKRDEELAELNRGLEQLVEKRTEQLKDEMKKISNLLNNMKQAVFSIDKHGVVVAPVSRYSETIFNQSIEGKSVYEHIYSGIKKGSELDATLKTSLLAVFGEDDLQWSLMEDNFPSRLEFYSGGEVLEENLKILKVAYTPLWDDAGNLDKIMMVIQDVTELEKLEREVALQKASSAKNIQIIQELASSEVNDLRDFFNSSPGLIFSSKDILSKYTDRISDVEDLKLLFRNLHTLKGNSRVFNMGILSAATHEVESKVVTLKENAEKGIADENISVEQIKVGIDEVMGAFNSYSDLAEKIFQIENVTKLKQIMILKQKSEDFEESLYTNTHVDLHSGDKVSELLGLSKSLNLTELHTSLQGLVDNSKELKNEDYKNLKSQEFKSFIAQSVNSYIQTSLFSPVSSDPDAWVLIVTKLFEASRLSQTKYTESKIDISANLKEIWSKAQGFGLYFIERASNAAIDKIEKGAGLEEFEIVLKEMWTYIGLVAHMNFRSILDAKKQVELALQLTSSASSKDIVLGKSFLISGFKSLERTNLKLNEIRSVIAKQLNIKESEFGTFFIGAPLETFEVPDLIDQLQNLKTDAFQNAEVKFGVINKLNILLNEATLVGRIALVGDLLRVFDVYNESEESIKRREGAQTIEVLDKNYNRLKEVLDAKKDVIPNAYEELCKAVNKLLDIPLQTSLMKYYPMVRDISKRLGKKVNFKLSGDDVSLSRDQLYLFHDALVHMIRNSLDHGIEAPEDRVKVAKSENGKIEIATKIIDGGFEIRLIDDGKGLNSEYIFNKAVSKGLITPDKSSMSENEKLMLIFESGFSTKEEVSDLSGRGVGMDVVKTNIEKIGGVVSLESKVGVGTQVIMKFKS